MQHLTAVGGAEGVVGAGHVPGGRAVPVDELVRVDLGSVEAGLVGGDVRLHDDSPAVVGETDSPLAGTVVGVVGLIGADVVGLAVVIPGDNLDERRLEGKHLVPAVGDELFADEDPVLGVEVGGEPGRDSWMVLS